MVNHRLFTVLLEVASLGAFFSVSKKSKTKPVGVAPTNIQNASALQIDFSYLFFINKGIPLRKMEPIAPNQQMRFMVGTQSMIVSNASISTQFLMPL